MSVVSVNPRSFILALFIRDDGERFLLGDNGYDFKDSQLHFAANTIENDEVVKQGTDGTMLAGQVRRSAVQSFDGYVGDATMLKETIEQMRRDFFAFFVRGHHFRVIYVDCNRNAWQRKGGYLVDAPEVKELWQIHPEYHVGLNFEDVNYYSYDEDADGEEILSNLVDVPVSTAASGGLVWDEDGAVSEDAEVEYIGETTVATPAKNVHITDATEAPLASFQLDGETSQNGTPTPDAPVAVQTVTGENVVKITGKNLLPNRMTSGTIAGAVQNTVNSDGSFTLNGTATTGSDVNYNNEAGYYVHLEQGQKYTLSVNNSGLYWRIRKIATSTLIAQIDSPATRVTFTANTTEDALLYFVVLNNSSFSNTNFKVQLEKGSTATAYEPYQEQSYEVNLGKNLFDKDLPLSKTYYTNTGATATYTKDQFINFTLTPTSRSLIMSYSARHDQQQGSAIAANVRILQYNSSGAFISRLMSRDNNHVFSLDSNTTRILVCIDAGEDAYFDNLQLEYGSSATSYAAYFEPIELCKIGTYQDYIYKSGGKWYKHKAVGKITLDGSETWHFLNDGGTFKRYYTDSYSSSVHGLPETTGGLSDHFGYAGVVSGADVVGKIYFNKSSGTNYANGNITITISGLASTADAIDDWMTSNNTTFYYVLATPTDTEITNEALIEQLNALLTTARTFAGINNITTITPNEQGTLEISYYTKYQSMVVSGGYVWEVGGSGGATTVINNSIDNVSPIWKIFGPTQNPQLENSTTGETIEYVGMIAEGQTLTIDMGEQTASLDGLNVISNLVGDFISLAPGANRLIYSVLGDAGASSIGWSEIVG